MQDDTSACALRVLREKGAQTLRIVERRMGTGLDLDPNELAPELKNEVNLMAMRGTPVRDFGTGHVSVSPGKQIAEHEILEMRARGIAVGAGETEM